MKKFSMKIIAISLIFLVNPAFANTQTEQDLNKKNVLEFYDKAINQKNFDAAFAYLGPTYTQHNPSAADGPEGLKAFIDYLKQNYPDSHSEIKRVFADNNYVILHVHSIREPYTRGRAIFDLFRLENGKIVEHWDTIQDIPETSANSNGMF